MPPRHNPTQLHAAPLPTQVHARLPIDPTSAVLAARSYLATIFLTSAPLRIGTGPRGPLQHSTNLVLRHANPVMDPLDASTHSLSLSADLWTDDAVQLLALQSLDNGFVRALADGSLPRESFTGYVAQAAASHAASATAAATAAAATAASHDLHDPHDPCDPYYSILSHTIPYYPTPAPPRPIPSHPIPPRPIPPHHCQL